MNIFNVILLFLRLLPIICPKIIIPMTNGASLSSTINEIRAEYLTDFL
jgi:hypothetical protein